MGLLSEIQLPLKCQFLELRSVDNMSSKKICKFLLPAATLCNFPALDEQNLIQFQLRNVYIDRNSKNMYLRRFIQVIFLV